MDDVKLKKTGKIFVWVGLLFIPLYITLVIIDFVTGNWEWPLSVMWGGMVLLPLLGSVFAVGVILIAISKYGFRKVLHWLIIIAILAGLVWGGYESVKWVVRNTEYLGFLK